MESKMTELQVLSKSLEELLQRMYLQVDAAPRETVWELHEKFQSASCHMLRAYNARSPLLRLPTEILHQIVESIPVPRSTTLTDFAPVWVSAAVDSVGVIPISQSCHRLREIALSSPSLWRHQCTGPSEHKLVKFRQKNSQHPWTIVISSKSTFEYLAPVLAHRSTRELHMVFIDEIAPQATAALYHPWPELEFFSCTQSESSWTGPALPLFPELAPRLRFLHLQSLSVFFRYGFPTLTHLSLASMHMYRIHDALANFLNECPNLVNATFDNLNNPTTPRNLIKVNLPHLRRVTFFDMTTPVILTYLSLLSCERAGVAIQVLNREIPLRRFPLKTILPQYARGGVERLAIGTHSFEPGSTEQSDRSFLLSLTAIGRESSCRFARENHVLAQHLPLLLSDAPSLAHTRELWITNVLVNDSFTIADSIASALTALPALETITIVYDHSIFPKAQPNIRVLPKRSNPSFALSRAVTLNFVHWYSVPFPPTFDRPTHELSLRKLASQLATREYGYITKIAFKPKDITVNIDSGEYRDIQEYVPHVTWPGIRGESPTMPVPEYCLEPYANPGNSFPASLW